MCSHGGHFALGNKKNTLWPMDWQTYKKKCLLKGFDLKDEISDY